VLEVASKVDNNIFDFMQGSSELQVSDEWKQNWDTLLKEQEALKSLAFKQLRLVELSSRRLDADYMLYKT
jgi:hypothetical protein